MGEKSDFTELEVWKESRKFRNMIRELIIKLPDDEKYGLISQMRRASRSVTHNIAEGHGRFHYQENIQFCRMVRGSLKEVLDQLTVALDEQYITKSEYESYIPQYLSCNRLINGYIKFLKKLKNQ